MRIVVKGSTRILVASLNGREAAGVRGSGFVAILFLGFLSQVALAQAVASAADVTGSPSLQHALVLYRAGDIRSAIPYLEKTIEAERLARNVTGQIDALMLLSDVYSARGMIQMSLETLERAIALADHEVNPVQSATLYNRLGVTYQKKGEYERASEFLEEGITIAESVDHPGVLGALLNDLGNFLVATNDIPSAIAAYDDSVGLARTAGNYQLIATAGINRSRAAVEAGAIRGLPEKLLENLDAVRATEDSNQRVHNLLAIGKLYRDSQHDFKASAWRRNAYALYVEGLELAQELGNRRLASYALGYLGQLYEDEARYDAALEYTHQAAFAAQEVNAQESLYLWEWQIARLLKAKGNVEEAIAAYRQAITTLGKIRTSVSKGSRTSFRELAGPVYFEMADLLLANTASLGTDSLQEARMTLEQGKRAEVEDYFEDDCVVVQEDLADVDRVSANTAIIYPVILSDRTELLVRLPGGLKQYPPIPVDASKLTEEIRWFRDDIESPGGRYIRSASTLYNWLIAPLEPDLAKQNVDTLIIVPDGPLRTIPLGALHDGQQFLIQRYAIATTPGLTLTSPQPILREDLKVLASGLSEARPDFDALPNVETELANIQQLFPSTVPLLNDEFQVGRAETEMAEGQYSIVHIATHGHFDSDHRKSFLLASDDKLYVDNLSKTIGLRRFQKAQVELLVLSACETAAGDERAALGLAGVALRAGARSAIATLWPVEDESTAMLVTDFYERLKDPRNSKAKALQAAQRELIKHEKYGHPSYWAPFLLIGNWL